MKLDKYGVLLAVSSLPGKYGIGDFGSSAFRFIDFLNKRGYKYWQILPLNPIGPGNSPYMSTCSEAIDYRYIDLDSLVSEGLLDSFEQEITASNYVNYQEVGDFKINKLIKAFERFNSNNETYKQFLSDNSWVYQYALYTILKEKNDNKSWNSWDHYWLHYYDNHNFDEIPEFCKKDCEFHIFLQYIAYSQWKKVRDYAKKCGIKIIADCPFYVGIDSVDCWVNKDQFVMDEEYNPIIVSGCPPDAFSEDGQLWGTPIYDFKKMKKDGYSFLINRISHLASSCDHLRLDHFRAWDTYCVIPAEDENARRGQWLVGPRTDFFDTLYEKYPDINIIAEDLGELFESVHELRNHYKLPGMYVTQFLIFEEEYKTNESMIVYTGTHDNHTLVGWVDSLNKDDLDKLNEMFNNPSDLVEEIFKHTWDLDSFLTILPMQDLLKLDDRSRLNTPGTTGSPNWEWKLLDDDYESKIKLGY